MTKIHVLGSARSEFRQAFRWYRDRSPKSANRFALGVKSAVAAIREHPEQHLRWDDRYRYYLVDGFPYYVAYRYSPDQTVIVAIRHTSQDSAAWTDR